MALSQLKMLPEFSCYQILRNMNCSQKIFNFARKYCIDRHNYWTEEYEKLRQAGQDCDGSKYTSAALDTFPRYNIMAAILNEIESIDYDDLPTFCELQKLLVLAGDTAENDFTSKPISHIESDAINDERLRFINQINSLGRENIPESEKLPYRRTLSNDEIKSLWRLVEDRWGASRGEYYFPLKEPKKASLIAFPAASFESEFSPCRLQALLREASVDRIFELREYGEGNYLIDVDIWEPCYDGAEGFWFSQSCDWILYASHEGTITIGGVLAETISSEWKGSSQLRLKYGELAH